MKIKIKKFNFVETPEFYLIINFDHPETGEEMTIKMTEAHFNNLRDRNKIPLELWHRDLILNVTEREGRTQPLFYIYGYEYDKK